MRRTLVASAAVAIVLLTVPGCLEDTSGEYAAAGQEGRFALGFAYGGEGILPFDGFITIQADPDANTGTTTVKGTLNGEVWRIRFDDYAQQANRSFQDGGIARNLDEHGETGTGDTSIPKVRVDAAAWGEASVLVGNETVKDPLTGGDLWVAHYMVIMTGARDDATGAIHTADGQGTYDPGNPADAKVTEGDHEIHLVLRSHATAPANGTNVSHESGVFVTPISQEFEYENLYPNSEFNVTVSVSGNFAPTQEIVFTLRDPNGTELQQVSLPDGSTRAAPMRARLAELGTYVLEVEGQGISVRFAIEGVIMPPSNVVMNLWWEDVVFGAAANEFRGTADTMDDGSEGNATAGAPKRF